MKNKILIWILGVIGFIIFLFTSQIFTLFLLFRGKKFRRTREKILSCYACFFLHTLFNVRKKIIIPQGAYPEHPVVIICNHSSFIDIPLILMLSPKIIMVTTDWIKKTMFYGILSKFSTIWSVSEGYEQLIAQFSARINEGYSIMIFPETKLSKTGNINRFHKGAFVIAEKLKFDILPIVIYTTKGITHPGKFFFKTGQIVMKMLPLIHPDDKSWGEGYSQRTKNIRKMLAAELEKLKAK